MKVPLKKGGYMKRAIGTFVAFIFAAVVIPASSANAAPYCGITWGSLPKTAAPVANSGSIVNVRTGQQDCYDRMVVDITGLSAGYDVKYVSNVYAEGSGQIIPLTGGAKLQIVTKAPSYNPSTGASTYPGAVVNQPLPGVNLTGYQTFKSAKFAGSFEGQTTIGLGVRATLPFRVFQLDHRVVIDVAHQW